LRDRRDTPSDDRGRDGIAGAPPTADAGPDGIARADLKDAALAGVPWIVSGRVVIEVVGLASSIALARLIAPREFGIVALALFVHMLASTLAGVGVASALVQRPTITRAHREAAMMLSLGAGALLAIVVWLGAPLTGVLFGDAAAHGIRLVAPACIIFAISAPSTAMLQRRLRFRAITLAELVATTSGMAVAVALAVTGLDAEAIILGALTRSAVQAALILRASPPAWPRWHRAEGRALAAFGVPTALGAIGHLGFRNVDYAILGSQLGLSALGLYWRAYQVSFEYQEKGAFVVRTLSFPVYSRARDLTDMRSMRLRVMRVNGVAMLPLPFAVIALAPELVPAVYGSAWAPAVEPMRILACAAFSVPLLSGMGAFVLAAGKPRELMVAGWLAAIAYAAIVAATVSFGLTAVCVAIVAYHAVKFVLVQQFLLRGMLGVRWRDVATESAPGFVAGAALMCAAFAVARLGNGLGAPDMAIVAVALPVGMAVYLAVLRWAFAAVWKDLSMLFGRVYDVLPLRGPLGRFARSERLARAGAR
jgi:lipopolysaccharide exporter